MEQHLNIFEPIEQAREIVGLLAERVVNAGGPDLLLYLIDSKIWEIKHRAVRNIVYVARTMLLPQPRRSLFVD